MASRKRPRGREKHAFKPDTEGISTSGICVSWKKYVIHNNVFALLPTGHHRLTDKMLLQSKFFFQLNKKKDKTLENLGNGVR